MELTFNNLTTSNGIICLSDVPNILTFKGSSTYDTYAEYRFAYSTISGIDTEEEYYIKFGDYSITATFDEKNTGGVSFWLPQFNSYENQMYSSHTIVKAFKNIPFISANYDVWLDDDDDGSMKPIVHIKAKKYGKAFNVDVSSNLPSSIYTWSRITDGGTNDAMLQGSNNKILCDVYRFKTPSRFGSEGLSEKDFVTSLEKNYYGKPVSFNVTPIISTLLSDDNYEDIQQFIISVYGFSDKRLVLGEQTSPMYVTNGYLCNFSEPFINRINGNFFAANLTRGDDRVQYNNTYLYTYSNEIRFSMYSSGNGIDGGHIRYVDSADNILLESDLIPTIQEGDMLCTYTVMLDYNYFWQCTYIDLVLPEVGTVRYNIIKPINAANESEVRRIYWCNEYNGISFFDFTGERTETRKETIEPYDKQEFDFHNDDRKREKTMVYDKNVDIEVKQDSHYIDKNGTYLFYSLQNCKKAWIEMEDRIYYIIINNLEIIQSSNNSNIYVARITYSYSRPDLS